MRTDRHDEATRRFLLFMQTRLKTILADNKFYARLHTSENILLKRVKNKVQTNEDKNDYIQDR